MRAFLFMVLMTATTTFAGGLDRLTIQDLNVDYQKPYGKGDVEKISIGFSAKAADAPVLSGPYPVEIFRKDTTLELTSPFVDIVWNDPWHFVHDMDILQTSGVFASFGKREHTANLKSASLAFKGQEPFKVNDLSLRCVGESTERQIEDRLMDDCRESLKLTIDTLDVPIDFFMAKLVNDLPPQEPMKVDERPMDGLILTSGKGDFSLVVYTRVVFYAGVRAWGHVSYEDNHSTIVVKINQIKFGYLHITSLVMKELKKRLKHPGVTITGNTIKVKIK